MVQELCHTLEDPPRMPNVRTCEEGRRLRFGFVMTCLRSQSVDKARLNIYVGRVHLCSYREYRNADKKVQGSEACSPWSCNIVERSVIIAKWRHIPGCASWPSGGTSDDSERTQSSAALALQSSKTLPRPQRCGGQRGSSLGKIATPSFCERQGQQNKVREGREGKMCCLTCNLSQNDQGGGILPESALCPVATPFMHAALQWSATVRTRQPEGKKKKRSVLPCCRWPAT
jgi:hypothetical protein